VHGVANTYEKPIWHYIAQQPMEPFKSDGEGFSTPQLQGVYMHKSKKGPTYPLLAGEILHGTPHTDTTHPHLLMKTPLISV